MIFHYIISPFIEPQVQRALAACLALSIGFAPVGIILIMRRMSLIGDSLSHAILPGTALGYVSAGAMSVGLMTLGGIITGLAVVFFSTLVTRNTSQKEDTSFASFYVISTAIGIILIRLKGGDEEVVHMLFGDAESIDNTTLLLVMAAVSLGLTVFAVIYRPLIIECFDPVFMRVSGARGGLYHHIFLALAVISLVAGFRALGTLMAMGLMLLPAASARFWVNNIGKILVISSAFATASSIGGLLISYHLHVPPGAAIVLVAAGFYLFSLGVGSNDSLRKRLLQPRHLRG